MEYRSLRLRLHMQAARECRRPWSRRILDCSNALGSDAPRPAEVWPARPGFARLFLLLSPQTHSGHAGVHHFFPAARATSKIGPRLPRLERRLRVRTTHHDEVALAARGSAQPILRV